MSLASGTRLGPYEIVGPLGAGGMGEVYRANEHEPVSCSEWLRHRRGGICGWSVAQDGQRFLLSSRRTSVIDRQPARTPIVVVLNWLAGINK